ncbi:cytochrome P450 [Streptomyces microflavus]|uniref:Cytochrome P450 n=1 Tax=Streptomyces microflavus TaxID=1919 RepID=A0A7H8MYK6_STRMI|nr:cytochrome P450 [Streptomyces microflavus]QKW47141.1 cytochrome P450 [Streptomyces microflavus]
MTVREIRRFRQDPLRFLEDFADRSPTDVFRLPWDAWCVRDTDLSLKVLRDPLFHSGMPSFFGGLLPSRPAQMELGRAVRHVVRTHIPVYRNSVARAVAELPNVSAWPQSGLTLVHRSTAELLLHPDSSPALRQLLVRFVKGGLIRSPHLRGRLRAEALRPKLVAAVTEHIAERRATGVRADAPRDVLDAVIGACPEEVTDRTVARLYLLLVVSIVGPTGYAVAWSVLLACLHHPPGSSWPWPADWIAREAARHRPVTWMVGRSVPHPAEYGGIPFQSGATLSVSPYLLHHDKDRWGDPEHFRPERWDEPAEHRGPYLPFSAGPFTCSGAAVAQALVTEAVAALNAAGPLSVRGGDMRPVVTDGAVPRTFELQRVPTR